MIAQNPRFYTHKNRPQPSDRRRVPRAEALHSWHESCLAFFVNNKDFDERLIVTYSIKYRNYLRKIREKQVIRAKKTLHNGKVHAKKGTSKVNKAIGIPMPPKI